MIRIVVHVQGKLILRHKQNNPLRCAAISLVARCYVAVIGSERTRSMIVAFAIQETPFSVLQIIGVVLRDLYWMSIFVEFVKEQAD